MARSDIPVPKYQIGTLFKQIDSGATYKLSEVRFDTYILIDKNGKEYGESLFTLEYDYEVKDGQS